MAATVPSIGGTPPPPPTHSGGSREPVITPAPAPAAALSSVGDMAGAWQISVNWGVRGGREGWRGERVGAVS